MTFGLKLADKTPNDSSSRLSSTAPVSFLIALSGQTPFFGFGVRVDWITFQPRLFFFQRCFQSILASMSFNNTDSSTKMKKISYLIADDVFYSAIFKHQFLLFHSPKKLYLHCRSNEIKFVNLHHLGDYYKMQLNFPKLFPLSVNYWARGWKEILAWSA